MKTITIKNQTSGVDHLISFKERPASPGKVVILLDGRSIGKINKKSKAIFCDRKDVYLAVSENMPI